MFYPPLYVIRAANVMGRASESKAAMTFIGFADN
jgi:hypothetical protein